MADGATQREAVIACVLDSDGESAVDQRRAAFDNRGVTPPALASLLDKVARSAYKVIDEDVAAARAAGLGEDQLFELVVVAAIGQASRQLDAALAALDAVGPS